MGQTRGGCGTNGEPYYAATTPLSGESSSISRRSNGKRITRMTRTSSYIRGDITDKGNNHRMWSPFNFLLRKRHDHSKRSSTAACSLLNMKSKSEVVVAEKLNKTKTRGNWKKIDDEETRTNTYQNDHNVFEPEESAPAALNDDTPTKTELRMISNDFLTNEKALAQGFTPLHLACFKNVSPEVVAKLVHQYPTQVVSRDRVKRTPLHILVCGFCLGNITMHHCLKIIDIFCQTHAEVIHITDCESNAPVDMAQLMAMKEQRKIIEKKGGDQERYRNLDFVTNHLRKIGVQFYRDKMKLNQKKRFCPITRRRTRRDEEVPTTRYSATLSMVPLSRDSTYVETCSAETISCCLSIRSHFLSQSLRVV
jgi:hypothetical protein